MLGDGKMNLTPRDAPTAPRFFLRKSSADGDSSSRVAAYAGDRYPSSTPALPTLLILVVTGAAALSFHVVASLVMNLAGDILTPKHVLSSAWWGESQYSRQARFCSETGMV